MKINKILFRYIAKQFIGNILTVFLVIAAIIFLVDSLELIRRSYGKVIMMHEIFTISLLRLPITLQDISPFIFLIASMLSYAKLARSNQLLVLRANGISALQFIFPSMVVSMLFGVIYITCFTPITSNMFYKSELLEDRILRSQITPASAFKSGIWLKDYVKEVGNIVINAKNISPNADELRQVTILINDDQFKMIKRVDAETVKLIGNSWHVEKALISDIQQINQKVANFKIPTTLNINKLQESFNKQYNLSFWQLPYFIFNLQQAGLPALRHTHYFWMLFILPFMLAAMTLLAGSFVTKFGQRIGNNSEIFVGIMISFVLYFTNQMITALGLSSLIPLSLSIIFHVVIAYSVAILMIIHREDN